MSGSISTLDSVYTWTFTATSGDSWGGTLIDDTTRYDVGSTLATAYGRYTIVAEVPQGTNMAAYGYNDGWIAVAWYRDAKGLLMLTQTGDSTAAGTAGLGSERDFAWNGSAWDSFGQGGADQADPADLPDSLFTWKFTADGGDILYGTLLDDSAAWAPGDTLAGARGVYQILTETPYGQDLGTGGAEGTVTTTRYTDGSARTDFTLESGGTAPTGYGGLGSEVDRAWTGTAWVQVGQGGTYQADRIPDRIFDWTFTAGNGDRYTGRLVSHSTAWQVGDTLATDHGRYAITAATTLTGSTLADQTVWTTGYYDASEKTALATYAATRLGGAATGSKGLGSEYDQAWDGDEWDDFGHGGRELATVDRTSLFSWRFQARNGDVYTGWLVDDAEARKAGDVVRMTDGNYVIEGQYDWGGAQSARGQIFTTAYYDSSQATWLYTYQWQIQGGKPSGADGFGSEYDYAWTGNGWDDFGGGGIHLASITVPHLHGFTFSADNGDLYSGWVIADADTYRPGDSFRQGNGSYRIDAEYDWTGGTPIGTVYTTAYYDSSQATWLQTYQWGTSGGQPSGQSGLGSEYDYAWTGNGWDDFGHAGAQLASIPVAHIHSFAFLASNGDIYTGWVVAPDDAYKVGDFIATSKGRYRIDGEYDWGGSAPVGTVYTTAYYDSSARSWFTTYSWAFRGGYPSGEGGIGSEYDYARIGERWDDFGGGGLHTASVDGIA